MSRLFSAFAIALRRVFSTTGEPPLGMNLSMASASSTSLPRIKSITWRALRGEIRICLATALASIVYHPVLLICLTTSHRHAPGTYGLGQIRLAYDRPFLP